MSWLFLPAPHNKIHLQIFKKTKPETNCVPALLPITTNEKVDDVVAFAHYL